MREQPTTPRRERNGTKLRKLLACLPAGLQFSPALLFPAPPQTLADAAGAEPVLTTVLASLACALGLSASLLYRHMHARELELRTRAETAEAELRAMLMMTDDAVLVLGEDGTVRAANPASEELFCCAADDIISRPLNRVIAQPLGLAELTKHGPVNFTTTARRGPEQFTRVEMLLSPVELSGRAGYLALIHESRTSSDAEITPRRARYDELVKAVQKHTHDLNNQLTTVLGSLSLALMATPGDPANQDRILTAKKTALRAQSLNQKLQMLTQGPEGEESQEPAAGAGLNIVPMPPRTEPPRPQQPKPASRTSRILILDDEEAICELVTSVLDTSGFEVTQALSVDAALMACEAAVRDGKPFGLVICDLSLPGGISGAQAAEKLRTIDPDLKAIVSSGYDSDPVMSECRKHRFEAAVAKPYELSKLLRVVGQVLAGDQSEVRMSA